MRRELIAAKCAIVVALALIAGSLIADKPSDRPGTILVAFAMLGLALLAYEGLSYGLALLLARVWGKHSPAPPKPPTTLSPLRPRNVFAALGVYLAAQIVVWIIVATITVVRMGPASLGQERLIHAVWSSVIIALPASLITGGIAVLLLIRKWSRRLGAPVVARILGLSWGSKRQIGAALATGAALSILAIPLMALAPEAPADPISQVVTSSISARWAWICSAVLLAPPIEELMFRGVMLGGLARTWNVRAAAVVSGGTFWLLHSPEWIRWPAAVAIGLLTIVVTLLRLRTKALGPSVAAHFAYNLVLAGLLFGAKPQSTPTPHSDGPRWAQLP
jgi:CAAX protease family protein